MTYLAGLLAGALLSAVFLWFLSFRAGTHRVILDHASSIGALEAYLQRIELELVDLRANLEATGVLDAGRAARKLIDHHGCGDPGCPTCHHVGPPSVID